MQVNAFDDRERPLFAGWQTLDHEQHFRAASCRGRLESQWEFPIFDPVEPKLGGGIELKIGRMNYLGGLTKRQKRFKFATLWGSSWGWGEIYTTWGFSLFFLYIFCRSTKR